MRNQKVLNNHQINWYEGGDTRLSYQMLFQESEEPTEDFAENVNLEKRLNERDEKWKNKLKIAKEKAYKEGFETGKAEGLQTARKEIDDKIDVIKTAIEQGHEEWRKRQKMIDPGLTELIFEVSEAILGIPVENEAIRTKLDEALTPIFQKLDEQAKPVLKVCESDLEYVQELKEEYASKFTVHIQSDKNCNPGEFELDTTSETIVHKFREMLQEFKKNLELPKWN